MKNITDMTDLEILSLNDKQVERLVKVAKMEAGVKLMEKPIKPEYEDEPKKDKTFYSVSGLSGISFETMEEAQTVSSKLKSLCANAWRYSYGSTPKPQSSLGDYERRDFSFEVSSADYYSPKLAEIGNSIIKRNDQLRKSYSVSKSEYDEYSTSVSDIIDSVWDKVHGVRRKYEKLRGLRNKLSEYEGLAENKKDGLTFFLKAYSVTDEELVLIQKGDLGDKKDLQKDQ